MATDIVYILGTGSAWNDNELRFSLRSLEAFLGDFGRVYLVGTKPRWIQNVVFLPFRDLFACRERNIMIKMARACGHPDLSTTFLSIHDDHFCLAPGSVNDIPNWAGHQSLEIIARFVNPGNEWRASVKNTDAALKARGLTTYNFDLHFPMLMDKREFPRIMDEYDWQGQKHGFVVKSLYGNTMRLQPTFRHDLKQNQREDLGQIVKHLRGQPWFSIGNAGLSGMFKSLLHELYPHPSKFETK